MSPAIFIPQLQPIFWPKIYYFYYVAHFASYTKAAKALHITQSSLSRSVSSLEKRLNRKLLVRSSRAVSLTPAGQAMLAHVQILLAELQQIEDWSLASTSPETILVSVAEPIFCDYLLEPLLRFQKKRPDLKLELRSAGCSGLASSAKHRITIGLGFDPASLQIQKPLLHFEAALYASQNYLQRFEPPLNLEDLSRHRLLLLHASIPGIFADMNWHNSLLKQSRAPNTERCLSHSLEHLSKMVEADFGIMAWVRGHPHLEHRPLTEILAEVSKWHGPQNQAYFSCDRSSFDTEGVQALYLYLKKHFEDQGKS